MVQRTNNLWENIRLKDSLLYCCLILMIRTLQLLIVVRGLPRLWCNGWRGKALMKKKESYWSWQKLTLRRSVTSISFVWCLYWIKNQIDRSWPFWRRLWLSMVQSHLGSSIRRDCLDLRVIWWLMIGSVLSWWVFGKEWTLIKFIMGSWSMSR